jgi:hypothetical protein
MEITIRQRVLAAVIGHKLGTPTDLAFIKYVEGRELDASWEQAGQFLLREVVAIEYPSGRAGTCVLLKGADDSGKQQSKPMRTSINDQS